MKRDLKISGFKTPENYFENFEELLICRIEEEGKLPKSSGLRVPETYFDNLEDRVLRTRIHIEKQPKVIPLFSKKHLGYAAAVAACIVAGVMTFNSTQNKSTNDSIQIGLIDKYIDEGNLNIDLYELTTYLEPHDLPNVNFENQYISDTTLKNYLLENTDEEILMSE